MDANLPIKYRLNLNCLNGRPLSRSWPIIVGRLKKIISS